MSRDATSIEVDVGQPPRRQLIYLVLHMSILTAHNAIPDIRHILATSARPSPPDDLLADAPVRRSEASVGLGYELLVRLQVEVRMFKVPRILHVDLCHRDVCDEHNEEDQREATDGAVPKTETGGRVRL